MMNLTLYIPLFLALYTLTKFLIHKLQNLPPTPFPCFPIIGHIHLLKPPLHRTLATLSEAYGPAFYLRVGFKSVLVISSQSVARDCLRQNTLYQDNPNILAGKFIGQSNAKLLLSALPSGRQWQTLRRILMPDLIYSGCLNLFSTARREEVKSLIRRLHTQSSDDRGVEMKKVFYELMYRIFSRVIVGDDWCNGENGERFGKVLEEMIKIGKSTNIVANYVPFSSIFFGNERKLRKKFARMHGELDQILQNLIDDQRTRMNSDVFEDDSRDNTKNKSMIQVMLSLQRKDQDHVLYSDDIIKNLVLVLLIAIIDTSSTTMEWALSLLLNNPRVLHKAQAEIDHNVGPDRLIDEPDRLPYLNCIIKETLRMYPASPQLVPHYMSSKGCILGGRFHVPRGTLLLVNMWAIHNCPKTWDEPRVFKPERFQDETQKEISGYKFMDLGSGNSQSSIELMAISTSEKILGSILQCFDFETNGEIMVDMEEGALLTMTKVKPLEVLIRPRSDLLDLISRI
ncbi:hypothetical protein RND81_08G153700 [Saponaria officinalis]|uniref:Cytochrome P450 n=1 Tax=Saponaria officinalis TaxID=3572 RepID=A0AAW1JB47_SAPOF